MTIKTNPYIPPPPIHLVPIEALTSPYHDLPAADKQRAQALISTEDLLKLRSYYPRKGVVDAVISGMVRGLILHIESLNLHAQPQSFCKNEQVFIQLIKSYVPGTPHSRIAYTLDNNGNPDLTILPPCGTR